MKMLLLALCMSVPGVAQTDLIGGRVVDRADWPDLIRIRQGGATCSAVIVGPRAVMTAAHCSKADGEVVPVSESEEVVLDLGTSGARFTAKCTLSPLYRSHGHDVALCLSNANLPPPFAVISSEPVRLGDTVTLSGYGCTRSDGTGGNNGVLKVGNVRVVHEAVDEPKRLWFETLGTVALCYGDSGGPAYKPVVRGQPHQVVGINSMGNIRDRSYLVALAVETSQDWILAWSEANHAVVCGVGTVCK